MKRPSFQFYPADWRTDAALQSCSIAARGFWLEAMNVAHECVPYGHLYVNGVPMTVQQLSRLVGVTAREGVALLAELDAAGVPARDDAGAIYSKRMVRDEAARAARAAGGHAGASHGQKGAEHGAKGGRPKAATGDNKPPSYPPPSSSSPSTSPVENSTLRVEAKPRAKARRSLPEDFPAAPDKMWAHDHWLAKGRADLCDAMNEEIAKFRDHHTGKATMSADWPGSWRTWARNAMNFTRRPAPAAFKTATIHKVA